MKPPDKTLHTTTGVLPLFEAAGNATLAGGAATGTARQAGMTLIEILIVVTLLAIISIIVIPRYAEANMEAKIAAAQEILHSVQTQIAVHRQTQGGYPEVIDPRWFAAGDLPENPFDPDHPIGIQYVDPGDPKQSHPGTKSVRPTGSFWYNPSNGCFRAYVRKMPTSNETLQLYNHVNGCNLTALNQIAVELEAAIEIEKP